MDKIHNFFNFWTPPRLPRLPRTKIAILATNHDSIRAGEGRLELCEGARHKERKAHRPVQGHVWPRPGGRTSQPRNELARNCPQITCWSRNGAENVLDAPNRSITGVPKPSTADSISGGAGLKADIHRVRRTITSCLGKRGTQKPEHEVPSAVTRSRYKLRLYRTASQDNPRQQRLATLLATATQREKVWRQTNKYRPRFCGTYYVNADRWSV